MGHRYPVAAALVFVAFVPLCSVGAIRQDGECNLLTMFPFTMGDRDNSRFQGSRKSNIGFSHMAAALLAIDHFNERDSRIVPELASNQLSQCSVYFNESSSFILDSHGEGTEAVAEVIGQVYSQNTIDALVGGYNDQAALEISVVANAQKIPYLAYGGMNQRVVMPFFYPYTSRTAPDVGTTGRAILSFLVYLGRTDFISILQAESDTAFQLKESILYPGAAAGMHVDRQGYFPPIFSGPQSGIRQALSNLKDNGFKTIVSIMEDMETEIPIIADAAEELRMNRGDFVWLFAGKVAEQWPLISPSLLEMPNVRKLMAGSAIVKGLDGFSWNAVNDPFLTAWKLQNVSFVNRVNAKNPVSPGAPGYFVAENDYFQELTPEAGSSFIYDSIMAFGFGLCQAEIAGDLTPMSVVSRIHSADFEGSSGPVNFGSDAAFPGSRSRDTVTFGAFNVQVDSETGQGEMVLTHFSKSDFESLDAPWNQVAPFIFADGSFTAPVLLRETPEQNYLSSGLRIFGFCMCGVAVLLVLTSAVWVHINRKERIVRAAQPFFLYVIHAGSFLLCWAIVTISFDESYGTSVEMLGRLCTITPWIVTLGIIFIYGALFAKLWRINKILQFRRRAVTVRQVVWPIAILVITAIGLLTAWTIVEGFDWNRIEIDNDGESLGKCQGENSKAWFTPIFLLIVIPVLMTAFMAWRTRDIHDDFSESSWISILIAVQIQVLIVAIPVLNIIEMDSADARYIGQMILFWVYPVSTILLLIGPKVHSLHFQKAGTKKRGDTGGGVHISGVDGSVVSSRALGSASHRGQVSSRSINRSDPASSHSGKEDYSYKEQSSRTIGTIHEDATEKKDSDVTLDDEQLQQGGQGETGRKVSTAAGSEEKVNE